MPEPFFTLQRHMKRTQVMFHAWQSPPLLFLGDHVFSDAAKADTRQNLVPRRHAAMVGEVAYGKLMLFLLPL